MKRRIQLTIPGLDQTEVEWDDGTREWIPTWKAIGLLKDQEMEDAQRQVPPNESWPTVNVGDPVYVHGEMIHRGIVKGIRGEKAKDPGQTQILIEWRNGRNWTYSRQEFVDYGYSTTPVGCEELERKAAEVDPAVKAALEYEAGLIMQCAEVVQKAFVEKDQVPPKNELGGKPLEGRQGEEGRDEVPPNFSDELPPKNELGGRSDGTLPPNERMPVWRDVVKWKGQTIVCQEARESGELRGRSVEGKWMVVPLCECSLVLGGEAYSGSLWVETKRIKGGFYRYLKYRAGGKKRSLYLGKVEGEG